MGTIGQRETRERSGALWPRGEADKSFVVTDRGREGATALGTPRSPDPERRFAADVMVDRPLLHDGQTPYRGLARSSTCWTSSGGQR